MISTLKIVIKHSNNFLTLLFGESTDLKIEIGKKVDKPRYKPLQVNQIAIEHFR